MIDDAGDTGGRLGLSGMELQESIVEDRERERERWTKDESLASKGQEEAEVSQSSMRDKGKEGSLLFRALMACAFLFVFVLS